MINVKNGTLVYKHAFLSILCLQYERSVYIILFFPKTIPFYVTHIVE